MHFLFIDVLEFATGFNSLTNYFAMKLSTILHLDKY